MRLAAHPWFLFILFGILVLASRCILLALSLPGSLAAPAGPVYYTDLPPESGSRTLGEYELAW